METKSNQINPMIMEKKSNFRVRVMKYAWQLWRTTKQAWRVCMIKALSLQQRNKRVENLS